MVQDAPEIELCTWQLPEWDIRREERSEHYGCESWGDHTWGNLQALYPELERRLDTDQFVWCTARYVHWDADEVRRLWVLRVPVSRVLAFTDTGVWGRLMKSVPEGASDVSGAKAWRGLLLMPCTALARIRAGYPDSINALVEVPVPKAWVVDASRYNKGIRHAGARYEDLPRTVQDAEACRGK